MLKKSLVPWPRRFGLWRGEREEEHPLDAFHREVDHLFEDFWRGFDLPMLGHYEPRLGAVTPKMDVREEEDRFLISVELPGMDEKDVEIALSDNVLTIKGEKKTEKEETEKGYAYRERSYGSFQRSIPLHTEVLTDKVQATFEKGVLTVELPKTPEAKKAHKKIPIHVSGKVKKPETEAA